MKNWTENEKPDFIEVAFSAERSIEDEIERESSAEVGTVVFSYLIMFFYITIALGKFRRISTLLVNFCEFCFADKTIQFEYVPYKFL